MILSVHNTGVYVAIIKNDDIISRKVSTIRQDNVRASIRGGTSYTIDNKMIRSGDESS